MNSAQNPLVMDGTLPGLKEILVSAALGISSNVLFFLYMYYIQFLLCQCLPLKNVLLIIETIYLVLIQVMTEWFLVLKTLKV